MARQRTREERLMGAAVLKMTFVLRGQEQSPEFTSLYRGICEDLAVTEAEVDAFLTAHHSEVESRARKATGKHHSDA